jgi:hypothetical protein
VVEHLPSKLETLSSIPVPTKKYTAPTPVAHTYNASYSGGRGQEDHGSKPASVKQFERTYLEKIHHTKKRAGGVARGVGPKF